MRARYTDLSIALSCNAIITAEAAAAVTALVCSGTSGSVLLPLLHPLIPDLHEQFKQVRGPDSTQDIADAFHLRLVVVITPVYHLAIVVVSNEAHPIPGYPDRVQLKELPKQNSTQDGS